jgi:hypothetical protein
MPESRQRRERKEGHDGNMRGSPTSHDRRAIMSRYMPTPMVVSLVHHNLTRCRFPTAWVHACFSVPDAIPNPAVEACLIRRSANPRIPIVVCAMLKIRGTDESHGHEDHRRRGRTIALMAVNTCPYCTVGTTLIFKTFNDSKQILEQNCNSNR